MTQLHRQSGTWRHRCFFHLKFLSASTRFRQYALFFFWRARPSLPRHDGRHPGASDWRQEPSGRRRQSADLHQGRRDERTVFGLRRTIGRWGGPCPPSSPLRVPGAGLSRNRRLFCRTVTSQVPRWRPVEESSLFTSRLDDMREMTVAMRWRRLGHCSLGDVCAVTESADVSLPCGVSDVKKLFCDSLSRRVCKRVRVVLKVQATIILSLLRTPLPTPTPFAKHNRRRENDFFIGFTRFSCVIESFELEAVVDSRRRCSSQFVTSI